VGGFGERGGREAPTKKYLNEIAKRVETLLK
jgi:hypothetical protein